MVNSPALSSVSYLDAVRGGCQVGAAAAVVRRGNAHSSRMPIPQDVLREFPKRVVTLSDN